MSKRIYCKREYKYTDENGIDQPGGCYSPLVKKTLDRLNISYEIRFKDHWCGMSPSAVVFELEQEIDEAEFRKEMFPQKEDKQHQKDWYRVDLPEFDGKKFLEIDDWLKEHVGFITDDWDYCADDIRGFVIREEDKAILFKLTWW